MPRGYFLLSHDLLKELMFLPNDTDILAVEYVSPITCKVWVDHEDIPISKEGEARELSPVFKRNKEVEMIEWGSGD